MTWTRGELATLRRLSTPEKIQTFLDGLAYRTDGDAVCPRRVLEERTAHCFDGALLGAAALAQLGHPPALLDLRAVRDDDHVLAVYRVEGGWGAVAKSNFSGLRSRAPVHQTLRELVLSYFEGYFNLKGERTLREFSPPLSLRQFDPLGWRFRDEPLDLISGRLDGLRHRQLLSPAQVRRLTRVDGRSFQAGTVGTVLAGAYQGG